jgi:hypothetical protein
LTSNAGELPVYSWTTEEIHSTPQQGRNSDTNIFPFLIIQKILKESYTQKMKINITMTGWE